MTDKERLIEYLASKGVACMEADSPDKYKLLLDERYTADGTFQEAPFTSGVGIRWEEREIHALSWVPWPALLHEAGHILLDKYRTGDRRNESEVGFLGWEWAIVEKLGLSKEVFLSNNEDYGICWDYSKDGDGPDAFYNTLGEVPSELMGHFFEERKAEARRLHYLSEDGEPLVIERG